MASSSSTSSSTRAGPEPLPFHWQFAAGASAGIFEIMCMYPLDIVKTRFQLDNKAISSGSSTQSNSILGTLRKIVADEGWSYLYRGMLAPILVEAPKRATKFAANDFYTKILSNYYQHASSDQVQAPTSASMKQKIAVLSGIGAGMTEAFVVASFDVIKIRMQDPARLGQYANTWDCLRQVVQQEGLGALTQGLEATIWRHGAWNGGYFGVIFLVKQGLTTSPTLRKFVPSLQTTTNESTRNFIAGTIGGIVGTICNTPFDVVKTRIQNQNLVKRGHVMLKYKYALPGLWTVMKEEGALALYKGFLPKVIRLGPGGGILLVVYEWACSFIRKHLHHS